MESKKNSAAFVVLKSIIAFKTKNLNLKIYGLQVDGMEQCVLKL